MSVAEGLGSAELVGAGGLGIGSGPSFAEKLVVVRERREKAASDVEAGASNDAHVAAYTRITDLTEFVCEGLSQAQIKELFAEVAGLTGSSGR